MPTSPTSIIPPKLNDRLMLTAMSIQEVDAGDGQVAQEAVMVLGDFLGLTVVAVESHPLGEVEHIAAVLVRRVGDLLRQQEYRLDAQRLAIAVSKSLISMSEKCSSDRWPRAF